MRWVINPQRNQALLDDVFKIALEISDEQELSYLQSQGLSGEPQPVQNWNDYRIYVLRAKDRIGADFNFWLDNYLIFYIWKTQQVPLPGIL